MPMPPNANAVFEQATTVVNASLATALADPLFMPQAQRLITQLDIPATKIDFRFLLDNRGLKLMKQNIEKKAALQRSIQVVSDEYTDNITVALRDLKPDALGMYAMQAAQIGQSIGPWQDQNVARLLKSGGPAFTVASFDEVPYFSAAHPMDLAGENISAYGNLDSGGAGQYWYLFDTRRVTPVMQNWVTRPEPRNLGPDSEHATKFAEVMWNIYADSGFGLTMWQYAYASNQALDETHFNSARVAMEAVPTYAKTDNGDQVMGVMPNLLVVGRSNRLAAEKLINMAFVSGNVPNPYYKTTDLLVLSYLP